MRHKKRQEVILFDKKGSIQIKKALKFDRYLFYELILLPPLSENHQGKKYLFLRDRIRYTANLIIIYPACLKVQGVENAKGNTPLHICHHKNSFRHEVLVAIKDSLSYCKFESIEEANALLGKYYD